jgi:radical SAM protein (TIGR01212 family)
LIKKWGEKPYYSFSYMLKERFGEKIYKLALNGGMSCPNRDGTLGHRGCIFCSMGGSGDFAGNAADSITAQIESQKQLISQKRHAGKYIAYFQAYTNTYAPLPYLERIFTEALNHPDIAAISIGTRPDCLDSDIIQMLSCLNAQKPVWVELGLQTIHPQTAAYIRRGYDLACFEQAVSMLRQHNLEVIVHTIIGLPGEGRKELLETIDYLNHADIQGIKLQLLHVLKDTDLATDYLNGKFEVLTKEDYLQLVIDCLEHLSPEIVIHRVTGDGPKNLLIAPTWSSAKRSVLNDLHRKMKEKNAWQGKHYAMEETSWQNL